MAPVPGGRGYLAGLSAQHVEVVRRAFAAFARGDLDTFQLALAPGVEWTTGADEPDQRTYRGAEGIAVLAAEHGGPWEDRFDDVTEFEELVDLGDWVVVPWVARVRGRGSGIPMEIHETYAVRVEGGLIVRVDEYRTKQEALDALAAGP